MAYRQSSSEARRDAQSVEIALALFIGVGVFLGLVVPVAVLAHITGLTDATGWGLPALYWPPLPVSSA